MKDLINSLSDEFFTPFTFKSVLFVIAILLIICFVLFCLISFVVAFIKSIKNKEISATGAIIFSIMLLFIISFMIQSHENLVKERGYAYDRGYNDGYESGFSQGHSEGREAGYFDGYRYGFADGEQSIH